MSSSETNAAETTLIGSAGDYMSPFRLGRDGPTYVRALERDIASRGRIDTGDLALARIYTEEIIGYASSIPQGARLLVGQVRHVIKDILLSLLEMGNLLDYVEQNPDGEEAEHFDRLLEAMKLLSKNFFMAGSEGRGRIMPWMVETRIFKRLFDMTFPQASLLLRLGTRFDNYLQAGPIGELLARNVETLPITNEEKNQLRATLFPA